MATVTEDMISPRTKDGSYVEWGAVFAGAMASLAVSLILLTFGGAVGLSAVSPWTSTAGSITAIGIGSAFWILLVAIWSFLLGGYLAGRLRHRTGDGDEDEVMFRDSAHGMLAWALAVVLAGTVAAATASLSRSSTGDQSVGSSAAATRAVDSIVRSARPEMMNADTSLRALIGHALVRNVGADQLPADDKSYLTSVASARSGLDQAGAETRVNAAFTQLKTDTNRARKAGVVMGFLSAATLLVAGVAAWWAAGVGGKHRDEGSVWEGFRRGTRQSVLITRR